MRTLAQVAETPETGDCVAFTGGKLTYRIKDVVLVPNAVGAMIVTEREETFRVEPYVRTKSVVLNISSWSDLVYFGGSLVTQ